MSLDEEPIPEAPSGPDNIAMRVRNFSVAIIAAGTVIATITGFAVKGITAGVRADVQSLHEEIRSIGIAQERRAFADSARFERAMDVLELAVVAIVEPDGSNEQRDAVAELRRRRHVTPH